MKRDPRPGVARPTRLAGTFLEKVWGSTELEPWFPRSEKKIGEVWFTPHGDLPVLLKFLFTSEKLSVQVHPDGPQGKTEMWHILRAEPGAAIALGFHKPISRERLREAAQSGEIEHLLRWFPVKAGETYFSPAGTVHAIGQGIALCEIQQYSDTTYRLYDYGRPRELHLDAAVRSADLGLHPGPVKPLPSTGGYQTLVQCDFFETRLLEARPGEPVETDGAPLLMFTHGCGLIGTEAFRAGDVWQRPDRPTRLTLTPETPVRALSIRGPLA